MKFLEIDSTSGIIKQSSTEATSTPTPNAIPIADSNGKLDAWVSASSGSGSVGGIYGINVEALTGDKTLTPGVDPIYQHLDTNGSYRKIYLDTTNAQAGDRFVIKNISDFNYGKQLNIYQGTTQIGSQYPQNETEWVFDGTNWVSQQDKNQYNISIGYSVACSSKGVGVGFVAAASNGGVAVGYKANGSSTGVAIGYNAYGYNNSIAIGTNARTYSWGVAIGYDTEGTSQGVAIGYNAHAEYKGVAIGYNAYGEYNGISIGYWAGHNNSYNQIRENKNIYIGYKTGSGVLAADTWQASTSYNVGDYVKPTSWNGYSYKCIVAGTSGTTQPTWTTTIGDTVTDGTVTWECVSFRGNNNIYIGYDIEGQQNDTNQLNIGNLIYGNLHDKYWMIPQNVNTPTAKSGFGILYVASDGSLHYLGKNGTDTQLASA